MSETSHHSLGCRTTDNFALNLGFAARLHVGRSFDGPKRPKFQTDLAVEYNPCALPLGTRSTRFALQWVHCIECICTSERCVPLRSPNDQLVTTDFEDYSTLPTACLCQVIMSRASLELVQP